MYVHFIFTSVTVVTDGVVLLGVFECDGCKYFLTTHVPQLYVLGSTQYPFLNVFLCVLCVCECVSERGKEKEREHNEDKRDCFPKCHAADKS